MMPATTSLLLKIGELAKRTGLTVRTLHHYDAIGLLVPSGRAENGYRLYKGTDIERLYQVLALQKMGLPLGEIAAVIDDPGTDLAHIVARQIASLDAEIERSTTLRERLQSLQSLFMQGSSPALAECLKTLEMMNIYAKYFSREELATLRARKLANPQAVAEAQQAWPTLVAEVRQQMQQGASPADPAVQALMLRWTALARAFTHHDPDMSARVARMYQEESVVRELTGIDADMVSFIRSAALIHKEKNETK